MKTVTTEEVENMVESEDEIVLVDVLGTDHFEEAHIPGAINIPFENIAERALDELEKDQKIVVYCKNTACTASPRAAEKLEKLGFENVMDYENGIEAWKDAGNPTE